MEVEQRLTSQAPDGKMEVDAQGAGILLRKKFLRAKWWSKADATTRQGRYAENNRSHAEMKGC
jgi:hypothetical protein